MAVRVACTWPSAVIVLVCFDAQLGTKGATGQLVLLVCLCLPSSHYHLPPPSLACSHPIFFSSLTCRCHSTLRDPCLRCFPPAIHTALPAFSQHDHSLTRSVFNPNGPSSSYTFTFCSGVCCIGTVILWAIRVLSFWFAGHLNLVVPHLYPGRRTDSLTPNDSVRACQQVSSESISCCHRSIVTTYTGRR